MSTMPVSRAPEIKLLLNQSQADQVYYPNQSVTGTVQIVLSEPKWYRYVEVKLEGKGDVSWTESSGNHHITYSDSEVYADASSVVWGNKVDLQPTMLDLGTHTFPFQFTLPSDCPPTFDMFHGKIKYHVVVAVSSQVTEYKVKAALTVGHVVDLNMQPHLLEPVQKTVVKSITVCDCCNSGEAEITVNMPQTGFCTERDTQIPVSYECRNGSSQIVTIRGEVSQVTEFKTRTSYGHSTSVSRRFGGVSVEHIQPSTNEIKCLKFNIPTAVTPDFHTQIIRLSHVVSLQIVHTYGFIPSYIKIPVVVGNVPFLSQNGGISNAHSSTTESGYGPPQELPSIQPSCPPIPSNAELQSEAPPSYGAVTSGEEF